jgi:hypothetical protein
MNDFEDRAWSADDQLHIRAGCVSMLAGEANVPLASAVC